MQKVVFFVSRSLTRMNGYVKLCQNRQLGVTFCGKRGIIMIKGRVYDKSGRIPLSGIRMTDGRNITFTDEDGCYCLPGWERAHVVSACVLTDCHDDWFCMLEEEKDSYDFCLSPIGAEDGHCYLHISDTEIGYSGCGSWLEFVKKCVKKKNPAFLIQTGDICRKPGLETHYKQMNRETMGCPVRYTLGNHDYVNEKYGEYTFERLYGPVWYSFDLGMVHYVILPIRGGEAPGGYDRSDADRWLREDLSHADPEKKVVIFCHDLCAADEDGFVLTIDGEPYDLKEHNLLAWEFGHYHHHFTNVSGSSFNICTARPDCGGIDSSPSGVRFVRITGGKLETVMLYNDEDKYTSCETPVWQTKVPGRVKFSAPMLCGDRVIVGTTDDGFPKNCGISALCAKTGEEYWYFRTENSVKNRLQTDGSRIYAEDCEGNVYCISVCDGSLIWKTTVPLRYARHTQHGILLHEGTVYSGSAMQVFALDAQSGAEHWRSEKMSGENGPSRYLMAGGNLIVGNQWRCLYALNPADGTRVWLNKDAWYNTSTPAVCGNEIYIGSDHALLCIDAVTGETKQNVRTEFNFNTAGEPLITEDSVYLATADSGIVRFDRETFAVQRIYPCGSSLTSASPYVSVGSCETEAAPVLTDSRLIYTAADGYLYICDPEDGREIRKIRIGAPSFVSPVCFGDCVITADFSGQITAFSLSEC